VAASFSASLTLSLDFLVLISVLLISKCDDDASSACLVLLACLALFGMDDVSSAFLVLFGVDDASSACLVLLACLVLFRMEDALSAFLVLFWVDGASSACLVGVLFHVLGPTMLRGLDYSLFFYN
jgi:hypothetical protein